MSVLVMHSKPPSATAFADTPCHRHSDPPSFEELQKARSRLYRGRFWKYSCFNIFSRSTIYYHFCSVLTSEVQQNLGKNNCQSRSIAPKLLKSSSSAKTKVVKMCTVRCTFLIIIRGFRKFMPRKFAWFRRERNQEVTYR